MTDILDDKFNFMVECAWQTAPLIDQQIAALKTADERATLMHDYFAMAHIVIAFYPNGDGERAHLVAKGKALLAHAKETRPGSLPITCIGLAMADKRTAEAWRDDYDGAIN